MLDDETLLLFPSNGTTRIPLIFEPQLLRCRAAGPTGYPLTVLLDTGTDPSVIDLHLARRLGLRLGDFGLGHDALSDAVPYTETVLPWLRLGDLHMRNLFALALDLSAAPFRVDIVLGYNVLRQMVLQVNYAQRLIHLHHPDLGSDATASADILLPLTFMEHFPALTNVTLCNAIPLPPVTIDTGSNGGLTLGPDLAARVGLQRHAMDVQTGQGAGFYGGGCAILRGQAASMHLGSLALRNVELDTAGNGAGDLRQAGRANMGNRVLARFASITLDYGRAICAFGRS